MRILVTGSEGNIGRTLVPHLREHHHVFRCDIQNQWGEDYLVADVKEPLDLAHAFRRFEPDTVIHMAGIVSRITAEASPGLTVDTNLSGTNNIIQMCINSGARLVYFSTSEVYGNQYSTLDEGGPVEPNNLYGLTKYMGEMLVGYNRARGLDALVLRPFMFYDEYETRGTHRSAMVRFTESLIKGKPIVVHRHAARSWLHMDDAVRIIHALILQSAGVTVNVGNPDVFPMRTVAEMICDHLGIGYNLIEMVDQPDRMTLVKRPDLSLQNKLTGYTSFIPLSEGIARLVARLEDELQ